METSRALPSPYAAPGWLRAAFVTGLLAGTLDLTAAVVQFVLSTHKNPVIILHFIASGLFGQAAFTNNVGPALVGLVLHYLIACSWALVFYWLYPRLPWLRHLPAGAVGLGYGVLVWLVMNLLVVPASRIPSRPFTLTSAAMGMGILMVCIGLPIALRAARFYTERRP